MASFLHLAKALVTQWTLYLHASLGHVFLLLVICHLYSILLMVKFRLFYWLGCGKHGSCCRCIISFPIICHLMSACCWLWIFICFSFFGFNRSSLGIWSPIKWHAQLSDTIVDELRAWSFILPIITFFYLGIRSTINSFNILNWFILSCRGFTLMSLLFAFPFMFFSLERTTWSLGLW